MSTVMQSSGEIGAELAAELRALRAAAKTACKATRTNPGVEQVHETRIALRRLQTGVDVATGLGLVPGKKARRVNAELREIERALGSTRDDDVFLEALKEEGSAKDLQPLVKKLVAHREKSLERLHVQVTSKVVKRTFRRAAALVERVAHPASTDRADSAVVVRDAAKNVITRAFDDVIGLHDARSPALPDDAVMHQVRAAVSALAFVITRFSGSPPARSARLAAELHAMQARLGTLHDHVLAVARVKRWVKRGTLVSTPGLKEYVSTRRAARKRQREGFRQEWHAFGNGFRERMRELHAPALAAARAA